jgi:hypothetical protein
MKTRFATFLGALIKQVPKFDEVFYVKVKKTSCHKKALRCHHLKNKKT